MENVLNIQITLDDEQLKSLITNNINDLPKEKLQEILSQAIKEVLTSEKGQKLFMTKHNYYDKYAPSDFLIALVSNADITEAISPIINEAVKYFSENYSEILDRCMKSVISEMFMDRFDRAKIDQVWDMMSKSNN